MQQSDIMNPASGTPADGIGAPAIRSAVILAAGRGTRLGSITDQTPKPLIELCGKPVLVHAVERCAASGVERVFINTHHRPERIREALGDGDRFGLGIEYSFEPELLGTAGALRNFREALGAEPFFVIYGDNYFELSLAQLALRHAATGGIATIALYEREDVEHSGIAVLDVAGRILRFIEKPRPDQAVSRLVNCGVYALSPEIFAHIPAGAPDFGRDVFPALLAAGLPLHGHVVTDALVPIDTPDMLREAQRG